jgi:uncharacterized membrane protein
MIDSLFNIHPAVIFAIVTISSVVIFIAIWFMLNKFYSKVSNRWPFFNRFIEKARKKGETPLVKKYGLVGLALLIAIPLPTIGVYGGTLLSWLMGMKWRSSLIAVVSGASISNGIVLLSILGIIQAVSLTS